MGDCRQTVHHLEKELVREVDECGTGHIEEFWLCASVLVLGSVEAVLKARLGSSVLTA